VSEGKDVLYRTSEVAEMLNVTTATVSIWIRKGIIKAIKTPGGHYRIPEAEIKKLMERRNGR